VRSRIYRPGRTPALDAVLAAARRPVDPLPLFLLFPAENAPAADAVGAGAELTASRAAPQLARASASPPPPADDDDDGLVLAARLSRCAYALVVPDGTWPYACEMVRALTPLLCPPATFVRLPAVADPSGAAIPSSAEVIASTQLRSEPAPGCMATAAAVAAALGALEGCGAVREALLAPVQLMAEHQRRRDAPPKGVRPTKRNVRHIAA
jgi:DTW domain-containing protein YfiP